MSGFVRPSGPPTRFVVESVAFWVLLAGLGAAAAWPIYRDIHFVILVVVATAVAVAIALVLRRRGWLELAAATVIAYLVLGVPLAVPTALSSIGDVPGGWLDLVAATVLGWKELATITTIPVGSYQTLLVPALIVFLAAGVAAVSLAVRARRAWVLVVPIALALQAFAVLFGSPAVSSATLGFSREGLFGLVAFFAALAYLLWRVRYDRRVAVRSSQALAGIRQRGAGAGVVARRIGLAGATVAIGVVIAALVAPAATPALDRSVLRSSVLPDENPALTESPLTEYRASFSDAAYSEPLLSVQQTGLDGARLRLAVLSYYDGQQYRAVDPSGSTGATGAFVRVPYTLTPPEDGPVGTMRITIDGYTGSWLPTVADLRQVQFTGADAQDNQDAFFYNQTVQAGIQTTPLAEGDTFTLTASAAPAHTDLGAPGARTARVDPADIPDSLGEWVRAQSDQSLPALVAALRARGYLSHSIFAPTAQPNWLSDLAGAGFAESRAGHSTDRIGTLFTQLLDKQKQSPAGATDAELVAAVGDDEQFATATALLAQYLGYPSRVVLGFALAGTERGADDIPACTDVCTGGNLTAWVEVQDASGAWVSFDTTPQHANPLNPVQTNEQPPKNGTQVLPDSATREQATATDPSGGDNANRAQDDGGLDLAWLATALKIAGLVLLALAVLVAPFATILVAKVQRRRRRSATADVEERIVAGWDEYVDAAIDHGRPAPTSETRTQTAALYGTPNASALATMADRAVFSPVEPPADDGERFWAILEGERLEFERDLGFWRRARAALSLRSFLRNLPTRQRRSRG